MIEIIASVIISLIMSVLIIVFIVCGNLNMEEIMSKLKKKKKKGVKKMEKSCTNCRYRNIPGKSNCFTMVGVCWGYDKWQPEPEKTLSYANWKMAVDKWEKIIRDGCVSFSGECGFCNQYQHKCEKCPLFPYCETRDSINHPEVKPKKLYWEIHTLINKGKYKEALPLCEKMLAKIKECKELVYDLPNGYELKSVAFDELKEFPRFKVGDRVRYRANMGMDIYGDGSVGTIANSRPDDIVPADSEGQRVSFDRMGATRYCYNKNLELIKEDKMYKFKKVVLEKKGQVSITLKDVQAKGACEDGQDWFAKCFGVKEVKVEDAINKASFQGKANYASWLQEHFPAPSNSEDEVYVGDVDEEKMYAWIDSRVIGLISRVVSDWGWRRIFEIVRPSGISHWWGKSESLSKMIRDTLEINPSCNPIVYEFPTPHDFALWLEEKTR